MSAIEKLNFKVAEKKPNKIYIIGILINFPIFNDCKFSIVSSQAKLSVIILKPINPTSNYKHLSKNLEVQVVLSLYACRLKYSDDCGKMADGTSISRHVTRSSLVISGIN